MLGAGLVPPVGQVVKRWRFYCCFPFAPFSPLPSLPLPVPVRLCPPLLAWVLGCPSGRCARLGWAVVQALPLCGAVCSGDRLGGLCRLCGLWGRSLPSGRVSVRLSLCCPSGAVSWGAGAVCAAFWAGLAGGAGCWAGASSRASGQKVALLLLFSLRSLLPSALSPSPCSRSPLSASAGVGVGLSLWALCSSGLGSSPGVAAVRRCLFW